MKTSTVYWRKFRKWFFLCHSICWLSWRRIFRRTEKIVEEKIFFSQFKISKITTPFENRFLFLVDNSSNCSDYLGHLSFVRHTYCTCTESKNNKTNLYANRIEYSCTVIEQIYFLKPLANYSFRQRVKGKKVVFISCSYLLLRVHKKTIRL